MNGAEINEFTENRREVLDAATEGVMKAQAKLAQTLRISPDSEARDEKEAIHVARRKLQSLQAFLEIPLT